MAKFSEFSNVICLPIQLRAKLMEGFDLRLKVFMCVALGFDFELTLHTLISITKLLEWNSNMKLLGGKFQLQVICKLQWGNCINPSACPLAFSPGGKPWLKDQATSCMLAARKFFCLLPRQTTRMGKFHVRTTVVGIKIFFIYSLLSLCGGSV